MDSAQTAQPVVRHRPAVYRIVEASLDLDLHDERATEGERFLKLKLRIENNGGGGGLPLSEDYFRLVVDGAPLAPAHAPIKLIKPNSAYDAMVVFAIPAALTAAELSVGEVHVAEAIPLEFKSAKPSFH